MPAIIEFREALSKDILGEYQDLMESLRKKEQKISKQAMHKDSSAVSYDVLYWLKGQYTGNKNDDRGMEETWRKCYSACWFNYY